MSRIKFGVGVSIYNAPESLRLGILAEKFGYDSIFIPDHLMDLEACKVDSSVILGAVGSQTSKIQLISAVTDIHRIHPAKLAQIVATLDELTGGNRAVLGVGAGEVMNTIPFGIEFEKPEVRISQLVEAVKVIRLLWQSNRSNPVSFEGSHYRIQGAWLDQKHLSSPYPRIYLGALHSSKLLRIVGEIADGWLDFLSMPKLYQKKISRIREGAKSARRDMDQIDTTVWLPVAFSSDKKVLDSALNITKILLTSERNSLKRLGIDVSIPNEEKYINCIPTNEVIQDVVRASSQVPNEVAREFMIYGDDVGEAIRKLDEFVDLGAKHFGLTMLSQEPDKMMRKFSDDVISEYGKRKN